MKNTIILVLLTIALSCGGKRTIIESNRNVYYPLGNVDVKFKYADSDAHRKGER